MGRTSLNCGGDLGRVVILSEAHPPANWNKVPDEIRDALVERALDLPNLFPRELAIRFTHKEVGHEY